MKTINDRYAEQLAKVTPTSSNNTPLSPLIAPKSISRTRQDIKTWERAEKLATLPENPKRYLLYNLYANILKDLMLKSQINNRMLKALGEEFNFKDAKGEVLEDLSKDIRKAIWSGELNKEILNTVYHGHSLVEFDKDDTEGLKIKLLDRQNVDPVNGLFYPDYTLDKNINYRTLREYGTWLLEFGDPKDLGLLNSIIPHVLFKRFAISCWSELGEIHGIPPRFMKTNTRNPQMMKRAENMMNDVGAAAWFIIDTNEQFEFAKQVETNGDVYKNLKDCCNNEMAMAITGAILGQDTKNGSRSKDQVAKEMLDLLVHSDLVMLEQQWNTKVIPALVKLGILPEGVIFEYVKSENLETLWKMVVEALPHYDVDPEWVKDKFGIEVLGKKEQQTQNLNLSSDFFV